MDSATTDLHSQRTLFKVARSRSSQPSACMQRADKTEKLLTFWLISQTLYKLICTSWVKYTCNWSKSSSCRYHWLTRACSSADSVTSSSSGQSWSKLWDWQPGFYSRWIVHGSRRGVDRMGCVVLRFWLPRVFSTLSAQHHKLCASPMFARKQSARDWQNSNTLTSPNWLQPKLRRLSTQRTHLQGRNRSNQSKSLWTLLRSHGNFSQSKWKITEIP